MLYFLTVVSSLLLGSSLVYASDCSIASNTPSGLIGKSFQLVTESASSPDRTLTTKIQGTIQVVSGCSFKLTGLTLSNAPASASIKIYGTRSFLYFLSSNSSFFFIVTLSLIVILFISLYLTLIIHKVLALINWLSLFRMISSQGTLLIKT